MPLLNYTSEADADKTANQIAKMLSRAGAKKVMTEYDEDQIVNSISFQLNVNGNDIGFKLPTDWKKVYAVMYKNKKAYNTWDNRYARQQSERQLQAVRTAWKIVHDWVEAQLAIIETEMVTTQQVFLPYMMMKGGQTLFEKINENPQFLLGSGE